MRVSALILEGVRYGYAGTTVLHDAHLRVDGGEIVALIGRNGAGKSTLLRVAAGWARPERGTIVISGLSLPARERAARQEVVLITDTPPFYDDLTAREHVALVLRANRKSERERDSERLLEAFDIAHAADAFPTTYSRGMRYKVALVLALTLRPALILLDEPFGPLDTASAETLWAELVSCAADGSAVLFSGHTLPDCARPHRFVTLEDGRVREEPYTALECME